MVDVFGEGLAAEERHVGLGVERPVEVDACAGLDLSGGRGDDFVREAVECAELVIFAVPESMSRPSLRYHSSTYNPQALWCGPDLSTGSSENLGIEEDMMKTLMEKLLAETYL